MADSGISLSDHLDGKRFHNIRRRIHGFWDGWMTSRRPGSWPKQLERPHGAEPLAQLNSALSKLGPEEATRFTALTEGSSRMVDQSFRRESGRDDILMPITPE